MDYRISTKLQVVRPALYRESPDRISRIHNGCRNRGQEFQGRPWNPGNRPPAAQPAIAETHVRLHFSQIGQIDIQRRHGRFGLFVHVKIDQGVDQARPIRYSAER